MVEHVNIWINDFTSEKSSNSEEDIFSIILIIIHYI